MLKLKAYYSRTTSTGHTSDSVRRTGANYNWTLTGTVIRLIGKTSSDRDNCTSHDSCYCCHSDSPGRLQLTFMAVTPTVPLPTTRSIVVTVILRDDCSHDVTTMTVPLPTTCSTVPRFTLTTVTATTTTHFVCYVATSVKVS